MTSIPTCVRCVLLAFSLLPATAVAEVIEFVIDPTRSHIEVAPGNEIFIPLGQPLISVTIPAVAPSSGTGAMLPDGTTSDGLVTSLEGSIVSDLDDAFASIRIIGRRSSIRLGESGSWLPGPPSAPTTPTAGEIAVEFSDATTLLSGSAVLRDTMTQEVLWRMPPVSGAFGLAIVANLL